MVKLRIISISKKVKNDEDQGRERIKGEGPYGTGTEPDSRRRIERESLERDETRKKDFLVILFFYHIRRI